MPLLIEDAPRGVDRWDNYQFSLHRGSPIWSSTYFDGLQDCPLLCVSFTNGRDWRKEETDQNEFWLYFKDRRTWEAAHRIARLLHRHGVPLLEVGARMTVPGSTQDWLALVAYKPVGSDCYSGGVCE